MLPCSNLLNILLFYSSSVLCLYSLHLLVSTNINNNILLLISTMSLMLTVHLSQQLINCSANSAGWCHRERSIQDGERRRWEKRERRGIQEDYGWDTRMHHAAVGEQTNLCVVWLGRQRALGYLNLSLNSVTWCWIGVIILII